MARTKRKDKQHADILERQYRALDLRKNGLSYRAIGERLDISYVQARNDIQSALSDLLSLNLDSADDLRQIELERIDQAVAGIMHWVAIGSPTHIQALARLIAERSKLLGLYAPEKKEIVFNYDVVHRFEDATKALKIDPAQALEEYIQALHAQHVSSGADSSE